MRTDADVFVWGTLAVVCLWCVVAVVGGNTDGQDGTAVHRLEGCGPVRVRSQVGPVMFSVVAMQTDGFAVWPAEA